MIQINNIVNVVNLEFIKGANDVFHLRICRGGEFEDINIELSGSMKSLFFTGRGVGNKIVSYKHGEFKAEELI